VTSYRPRTYFSIKQTQTKFLFAAVVTSAVIIYQLGERFF